MSGQPPSQLARRIAAIINDERRAHRDTQAALGAVAGLSQSQMSKVLRGERDMTVTQLAALCRHFGLRVSEVVREAEQSVP